MGNTQRLLQITLLLAVLVSSRGQTTHFFTAYGRVRKGGSSGGMLKNNANARGNSGSVRGSHSGSIRGQSGSARGNSGSARGDSNKYGGEAHKFESSKKITDSKNSMSTTTKETSAPSHTAMSYSSYDDEAAFKSYDSAVSKSYHVPESYDSAASKSYESSYDSAPSKSMKMSKSRGTFSKRSQSMSMRMSMISSSADKLPIFISEDEAIPTPTPSTLTPVKPTLSPIRPETQPPVTIPPDLSTVPPVVPMLTLEPTTPPPTTAEPTPELTRPPVPITPRPSTPSPTTPAPTTPEPTTLRPSTPSPTTVAPTTPAPTTAKPTPSPTPAPTTAKPTPKPTSTANLDEVAGIGDYRIDLSYASNVPTALQGEIQKAANRIQEIIVGDLSDQSNFNIPEDYQCSDTPTFIDDMWICAQMGDLPEFVDGQGGFDNVRFDGTYIPFLGYITLSNSVDEIYYPVLLHEMLHAIGFGTIWGIRDIISSEVEPCDYSMANSAATSEFESISGCSSAEVPLDQFSCSHWEESCLVDELMTPSLGLVNANNEIDYQFSRITVGALEDLGYKVNYNAADPYTAADMDPSCTCQGRFPWHPGSGRVSWHPGSGRISSMPRMSSELREKATSYGKKVLEDRKRQRQQRQLKISKKTRLHYIKQDNKLQKEQDKQDNKLQKEREYVGEKAIFLLLRENGWRYSMIVTAEDSTEY